MTAADLPQVVAIERTSFTAPWARSYFVNELGIPFSRSLVAHRPRSRDIVAGYLVRWHVAGEIHLLNLAVAAPERGRGLGRLLARAVLDEAKAIDASLVSLEVSVHNQPARDLYASLGFVEVRKRRNYYGPEDHALIMEWSPG